MNTKQNLIIMQMASDTKIPAGSLGYIKTLQNNPSPEMEVDSLNMLARYVPNLVAEYKEAV